MRGSGDHQRIGSPSENHGKMPREYASTRRSGVRLPPAQSNPLGDLSALLTGGKGASPRSHGITPSNVTRRGLAPASRSRGLSLFPGKVRGPPAVHARALVTLETFQDVVGTSKSRVREELRRVMRTHAAAADEQQIVVEVEARADLGDEGLVGGAVAFPRPFDQRRIRHVADELPFGRRANVDDGGAALFTQAMGLHGRDGAGIGEAHLVRALACAREDRVALRLLLWDAAALAHQ